MLFNFPHKPGILGWLHSDFQETCRVQFFHLQLNLFLEQLMREALRVLLRMAISLGSFLYFWFADLI